MSRQFPRVVSLIFYGIPAGNFKARSGDNTLLSTISSWTITKCLPARSFVIVQRGGNSTKTGCLRSASPLMHDVVSIDVCVWGCVHSHVQTMQCASSPPPTFRDWQHYRCTLFRQTQKSEYAYYGTMVLYGAYQQETERMQEPKKCICRIYSSGTDWVCAFRWKSRPQIIY